jgi:hypothetical protein
MTHTAEHSQPRGIGWIAELCLFVRLMGGSPQMQRPWQDPNLPQFLSSKHRPPDRRQIPGIATALDRHLPMVADQRLPPIATTFDSHTPRPQDHTASTEPGSFSSSRPSSPFRSSKARAEKRPRWHWSQNTTPILSAQTDPQAYVSCLVYSFGRSVAKVMTVS